MYVTKSNSLNMKFYFCSKHGMAAENALIDSGATENFINYNTIKRLGIISKCLPTPHVMQNVDRTDNQAGLIQFYLDLKVKKGKQEELLHFYVANLTTDRFILGFPYLQEFNPPINWARGKVLSPHMSILTTTLSLDNKVPN
jgi:hypothetical protein